MVIDYRYAWYFAASIGIHYNCGPGVCDTELASFAIHCVIAVVWSSSVLVKFKFGGTSLFNLIYWIAHKFSGWFFQRALDGYCAKIVLKNWRKLSKPLLDGISALCHQITTDCLYRRPKKNHPDHLSISSKWNTFERLYCWWLPGIALYCSTWRLHCTSAKWVEIFT